MPKEVPYITHQEEPLPKKRQWSSQAPLREQLHRVPPQGEGFLMRTKETEVLEQIFLHIVEERDDIPATDLPLIRAALELSKHVHRNDTRRDKTPYVNHPLRVAIREAQAPTVTAMDLMIDLLHDAKEDHGIPQEYLVTYFHDVQHIPLRKAQEVATDIYFGIDALDKNPDNKKLLPEEYHTRIDQAQQQRPDLHLWFKKYLDRKDNYLTDLVRAIESTEPMQRRTAQQAIQKYRRKISETLPYIAQYEPHEFRGATETIWLGEELIAA